jgi:hypothetical protein
MRKSQILFFVLLLFFSLAVSGQTIVPGNFETISWNEHFIERTATGDIWPGNLIVSSESSDVRVARLKYSEDYIADIYFPIGFDPGKSQGAVILVSGDSDSHAKAWCGRSLKDTNQYLQWGQVIAESGMIAITYELQNPENALENLISWIEKNKERLGIDTTKLGFFSTSENGCTLGMETIVIESRKYSGPKPAFSIFYYGLLPLRSSKAIYLDVPVLTVQTKDYMYRGIPESMKKFNQRVVDDGGMITALEYPDGEQFFDCKDDVPRSREIIQTTIGFMLNHIDGA